MEFNNMQELILKLKSIKKRSGISYARIMSMMEANGDYISISTLKRVFAHDSENESFNYASTLLPIARVLFSHDCEDEDTDTLQDTINELTKQLCFLRKQLDLKDEIIKHLLTTAATVGRKDDHYGNEEP